ncbi:MAG: hypothetical protein EAX90_07775 [Candidatus Heimdallarchaeota archaeon]|nr:hypothetical protein [Candidatus Heimdallarchaeota archaeon]
MEELTDINDIESSNENDSLHQDIEDNEETMAEVEEDKKPRNSWNELKFIPNKKRFILLTTIITAVEIAGLFIFAYPLTMSFGEDLTDLGLFLLPPFTGAFIAYFVQDKKEAISVSSINACASVLPFMLIFTLVEFNPIPNNALYYLIPILAILIQIAVAFTIARMRTIYRAYGDSEVKRESDEVMIKELQVRRQERGLEQFAEEEAKTEKEPE